ncbi:MAG TPA: hypothetical protein VIM22_11835 [Solirubrobacteraceae bacterium]
MTQTAPAAPGARAQRTRRGAQDTPGRLRLVSAALIVVGLCVGLGAAQSFWAADGALARADANAAQLVRLQDIQTKLVRADADATNAFLVGGLEQPAQRRDYDQAIERASAQVAFAARAQPADGEVLAALSTSILTYTGMVEQARAINRQGLPLGAQYLRDGSAGLRADALPLMEALNKANEHRVAVEFANARTARNLAIAAALVGLVVLAILVVSAVALGSVASAVKDVRTGSYAAARALASARIAAFDAKANESLTLISRGSGAAFETAWKAASGTTTSDLDVAVSVGGADAGLPTSWTTYTVLHQKIRARDDGGAWDKAVAAAVSRAAGSANAAFDAFDNASEQRLTHAGDATSSGLRDAESELTFGAWLAVLAGILAASLAWWGLSQRIEEYR